MDRGKTVEKLFEVFCKAYPLKSRQANQDACHAFWRAIKDKPCDHLARLKILELQSKAKAPSGTLMKFFKADGSSKPTSKPATETTVATAKYACPKQDQLKKEQEAVTAEINCLLLRERNAIISEGQEKELKALQNKKKEHRDNINKTEIGSGKTEAVPFAKKTDVGRNV